MPPLVARFPRAVLTRASFPRLQVGASGWSSYKPGSVVAAPLPWRVGPPRLRWLRRGAERQPPVVERMGTHNNLDVGPNSDEGGIDQFSYLKIDAPAPPKIRQRESNITKESVLKEGLKDAAWNVSSLADRVHFSRNKNDDEGINLQLGRDVANILFMERPGESLEKSECDEAL